MILVWKIASLRIIVAITACTRKKSNEWIEHSNLFQICWHWCELQAVPDNCDRLWCNQRRAALQVDHFPAYFFFFRILLEQNQGRDFPDLCLPHNVCDRWRCNQRMEGRKGMTLQVDEKGRRGEGYCLITQSQATTLGWYFIETMKMSNCQKDLLDGVCFPLCAMCLFGSSAGHSLKCLI